MRLCLVSLDIAPVRSSGLAVYAERLARRLVEAGHDMTMVAALRPGTSRTAAQNGMRVERVPIGRSDWIGYSLRAARHVRRMQRTNPFDVVHFLDCHFAWAYRGPFAASLFQSFRQRLTADGGRPYASSGRNRLFRRVYYSAARVLLERPTVRRAGMLIAPSEASRDEFVRHYGIDAGRIAVVPEAVDTVRFAPHDTSALRRRLGLGGARVLLHVGFKTPRKGLEYLVSGMKDLPDDVWLLLVGTWEPNYREKIIRAAGPGWRRVLEIGSVPDEEIATYFALADLVVLPSLLEGFGLPALEAMACGTPVVGTTAGALGEVIGPCGVLVPPGDTAQLTQAVLDLLDDDPRRRFLGKQARERAVNVFSTERAGRGIAQAYRRYLEG